MQEEKTDKELIQGFLNGEDAGSFEILIKRYLKDIYSFSYHFSKSQAEAEDITQETFVKIWKNLSKFDGKKKFKTWIFSIAKNTAIDYFRKKRSVPFSFFDNEETGETFADTVKDEMPLQDELAELSLMKDKLDIAIKKLPAIYKNIIFLRYTEDLTFEEISEAYDESINTVKSRYRRGMSKLKDIVRKMHLK
jgi:RNA polymerase sigma-70 factor (ECF subfamily)